MSYLLEMVGRGFIAELSAAFRDVLREDDGTETSELERLSVEEPGCAVAQRRLAVSRKLAADLVHDDLGIRLAR